MLASGLPEAVADDEPILRMLHETSKFSSTAPRVPAFMPGDADIELSTARHPGMPPEEVHALAEVFKVRPVKAGAVVLAHDIRRIQLEILADEEPQRHAIIVGWPQHADMDEQRSIRKSFALQLVSVAKLIKYI